MGPQEREAIMRSLAEVLTGGDEVMLNGLAVDAVLIDEQVGGMVVDLEDGSTIVIKVEAL